MTDSLDTGAAHLARRAHLCVLQECQRVLVEEAEVSPTMAISWCVTEDPELDGLLPSQWVESGRDLEVVLAQARRDATRLAQ